MHETDEPVLTGSFEELARLIGCESSEVARCVNELKRTGTADVTLGNGFVTLMSRRLKRELSDREQTRLRVQRHRGNAVVTEVKRDRVISKSKSKKKEEESGAFHAPTHPQMSDPNLWSYPMKDLAEAFPDLDWLPNQVGFIESTVLDTPADREAWASTITTYRQNYDPFTRSYLPTKTGTLLDIFKKRKAEVLKNATTKHANSRRTDEDVFAESAEFYRNYPG